MQKKKLRKLTTVELNKTRKGAGITGLGAPNLNPTMSGRLTLGQLYKMKSARENEGDEVEKNPELDRVKRVLNKLDRLDERKKTL